MVEKDSSLIGKGDLEFFPSYDIGYIHADPDSTRLSHPADHTTSMNRDIEVLGNGVEVEEKVRSQSVAYERDMRGLMWEHEANKCLQS